MARPGTFDVLDFGVLDGVVRGLTTPTIALTADLDFEEAAGGPISGCRRSVSVQRGNLFASALRGLLELDDG